MFFTRSTLNLMICASSYRILNKGTASLRDQVHRGLEYSHLVRDRKSFSTNSKPTACIEEPESVDLSRSLKEYRNEAVLYVHVSSRRSRRM